MTGEQKTGFADEVSELESQGFLDTADTEGSSSDQLPLKASSRGLAIDIRRYVHHSDLVLKHTSASVRTMIVR